MEFLTPKIEDYLLTHTDPQNDLLKHIDRETHLKILMPRMLSGHLQGNLLSMFSKMLQPKRILEIGTYTGYATLCLAEGLKENGEIHTIDINAELEEMVTDNFTKSTYKEKIFQHVGNALEIIPKLNETFDLVFIDADKKNNAAYFDLIIDKVRSGGLIIVDNVLWSGKVTDENVQDKDTINIRSFNDKITTDNRIEKLILPVRDGLFLILKI